jgi:alpha-ketoglutarate-dependent taurine dioxygenase
MLLTMTVSRRGVVFFRSQDKLTNALQKELIDRLGKMAGKPSANTLHVHPVLNNTSEFGIDDPQMSHISSDFQKHVFEIQRRLGKPKRYDAAKWHSDIQFEQHPADYTSLRLIDVPTTGGDTLWASGCALYERFSQPYQRFFETLTATFEGEGFTSAAKDFPDRCKIHEGPRGSPANVGTTLIASHPVVRTNPVTGLKSIYSLGPFARSIDGLSKEESDELLQKFYQMLRENHDLQVRFRWRNPNDIGRRNSPRIPGNQEAYRMLTTI